MPSSLNTLRASALENRCENLRFRQDQFHAFHTSLTSNADVLLEAIASDNPCTQSEASLEFYLALDAIRISYSALNFEKGLEEEYAVKYGKNNEVRRVAVGIVCVRPQRESRFYSVVSAVAAAIEAGNCVVVEVS